MRLKTRLRGIALWTWVAFLYCALAPEAVASGPVPAMPNLWVTAAALGLTLLTAAGIDQK